MSRLREIPPGTSEHQIAETSLAGPTEPGAVPADYVEQNRAAWDRWALDYIVAARRAWNDSELRWGLWGIPESELGLVAELPAGADVIELGCGTAAISAWLARLGLRPVAVDFSRKQLDIAARLQHELGPTFPLIHSNAENVPYDTESFDLAISEYGASLWCEPHRWLAETNRLLHPGGALVFIVNSPLLMACTPDIGGRADDRLVQDAFGNSVREYPHEGVVEFHPTHSEWVQHLRAHGFTLERLVEIRPPEDATARFEFASIEWARRWPSEEIWVARKTA